MITPLRPSTNSVPSKPQLVKWYLHRLSLALLLLALIPSSCQNPNDAIITDTPVSKTADTYTADVALQWAEHSLKLIRGTSGFSPPVASRALGYAGLTMYETIVPGLTDHRSLIGQLNGLNALPRIETKKEYNWVVAVNAGQAVILKNLFANTSAANKTKIDSLEAAINTTLKTETLSTETFERSVKFGQEIANAIFEWSKTDGGHEGYTRNFPATYVVPVYPGAWQPTENGQKIPMQPTWGNNRTFVAVNANLPAPQPAEFSTDIKSPYFALYLEVYQKNKTLTQEEKELSVWWADDPSETFTPPGHSYNLSIIATKKAKANLAKTAEALARTGMAVADAFVMCWKCKYVFNNERPYTMVRRTIDPTWVPFWPAPPFPGYSSGHATQSAASAIVLTDIFGDNFAFTDDSHVGRIRDTKRNVDFKARSFPSLWAAAEESAYSRFLGGIHTNQDNNTGLQEGKKIGQNINALRWKK